MAIIRVLCDDTLPFVNERVWSKVRSNGTVFALFLETRLNFKKWQIQATYIVVLF